MKRILIALFLCLFAFKASAWNPTIVCPGGEAVCETAQDSCVGTQDSSTNIGSTTANVYVGSLFPVATTTTICAGTIKLKKLGNPNFNIRLCIYSNNNSGTPADYTDDAPTNSGVIGTCSGWFVADTVLTTSYQDISFTGMSAGITSGAFNWNVIEASSNHDTSNYVIWGLEATDCDATYEETRSDNDGNSWPTSGTSTVAGEFQLYSR